MVTRRLASIRLFASMCALVAGTQAATAWSAPTPGTAAPAFRLPDQNGRLVSLAEQRGKWVVLYFYAKDNTPGCTTEACEFRDNVFAFKELDAVILGISVDDVQSHKAFAAEHRLPFTILSDADKQVARQYGVLHRPLGLMELARRETFIVDPRGIVVKHYQNVDPAGHSKQVLADLRALQAATRPVPSR
ncbi:MAG TPA: peroxiredoxin [Steroidobacteraceae bacterium]|jgi:peroxiredoxin Q/BCP|nr:peroxiredoxin [Steroidobacteraceae bacterium]